jgi:hypothetical protein
VLKVLYGGLIAMMLVFAAAMSFATNAVYQDQWSWGFFSAGTLMLFGAFGGIFVPGCLRSLSGGELRTAKAFLQLFGAILGLLFFIMALISWILGKRYIGASSAYTTLGLLIFLGFAGIGLQGALAMAGYFTHVRNSALVIPARQEKLAHGAADNGHGAGH